MDAALECSIVSMVLAPGWARQVETLLVKYGSARHQMVLKDSRRQLAECSVEFVVRLATEGQVRCCQLARVWSSHPARALCGPRFVGHISLCLASCNSLQRCATICARQVVQYSRGCVLHTLRERAWGIVSMSCLGPAKFRSVPSITVCAP